MRKALIISLAIIFIGSIMIIMACDNSENKSAQKGETKSEADAEAQTQLTPSMLQQAQIRDAFSGKMIDKNIYADYNGKRVYFCCDKSKTDFKQNPEVYIAEFERQGVILADAPISK